jgi:uncharacterized membrane protein
LYSDLFDSAFRFAGFFCHQLPERSLFIGGVQFPICIRCSALLAGATLAVFYLFARQPLPSVKISASMSLPMIVELWAIAAGITGSTNAVRAATALCFGFFALIGGLRWIGGSHDLPRRRVSPLPRRESS